MGLIVIFDLLIPFILIAITLTKGFERALPVATFLLMLFPVESQIEIPGLFDLTTQRVIVLTLLVLYLGFGRPAEGGERKLPLRYLLAVQVLWLLVATANSAVFVISLKNMLSQILDFFVVFYIFAKSIRSRETVRRVMGGFAAAMIFLAVFGVIEAYRGWSLMSLFPETTHRFNSLGYGANDREGRIQTTFGHPILFGGGLALAIPITLYLISVSKETWGRIVLWIGVMLLFVDIYKTGSRGPWMALILSLGILTLFGGQKIRRPLLTIAVLILSTLLIRPGVWGTLHDMYFSTLDPTSPMGQSYQWRYALYHVANRELQRSPGRSLWGYGPESFYYLGLTTDFLVDGEMHTVKMESCDSSVAGLMIETGYLGFLITSMLLATPLIAAWRSYRKLRRRGGVLPLVIVCNLCAYYFLMTNVAIYGWGQQSYMLWILIAVATLPPALVHVESTQEEQNASIAAASERMRVGADWCWTAAKIPLPGSDRMAF